LGELDINWELLSALPQIMGIAGQDQSGEWAVQSGNYRTNFWMPKILKQGNGLPITDPYLCSYITGALGGVMETPVSLKIKSQLNCGF